MPSLVSVLIVVLLTAAFAVFYAHRRFRQTRPYQWRGRVRARLAELVQQASDLRRSPSGRSADRWRAELLDQHLRAIPLTALLPYPGIGPGAVERLSAAGLRSVADLTRFDVQRVPGFGPAKSADVRAAVRHEVREAEGRFDAGACPEGQEFRRRVAAQTAEEQAEAESQRLRVEAVNAALARLAPLERLANGVTFLGHLLNRPTPGLTDEVMARPLPVAEVQAAPPPAPVPVVHPVAPPVSVPGGVAARPASAPPADLFQAALVARPDPTNSATAESSPLHRLRVFARFGFVVAKADGRVAKAERAAIRGFLADLFGHDPVLVRHIDPTIEQAETAVPAEEVAVREVLAVAPNPEDRRAVYAAAERIAAASGERNQKEAEMLARLRAAFGLCSEDPRSPAVPPPAAVSPPVAPPAVAAPDPRVVLDLEPGAVLSADLIRRRYTLLTEKADPAKAAAMGPEFVALAERKRADLRRAAEALIARFAVPLDPPATPPPPADLRHNPDLDDIFGG